MSACHSLLESEYGLLWRDKSEGECVKPDKTVFVDGLEARIVTENDSLMNCASLHQLHYNIGPEIKHKWSHSL